MSETRILHGDCLDLLATLPEASIDACVTDPPYDLTSGKRGGSGDASMNTNSPAGRSRIGTGGGFMGLAWDGTGIAFRPEMWEAVSRVLKPGAYLLACGGTRTYHRMASAIEDAGFEIRDVLAWLYGSGFPKSLNLGEGLGTALKPSYEPIVLARKPFKGTVRGNVETFGTGALNIDACRIGFANEDDKAAAAAAAQRSSQDQNAGRTVYGDFNNGLSSLAPYLENMDKGRWPANVVIDDQAAAVIDEQSGITESNPNPNPNPNYKNHVYGRGMGGVVSSGNQHEDIGGASRFYYVAKPSRAERDMGCEGLDEKTAGESTDRKDGSKGLNSPRAGAGRTGGGRNFHPTVKPVELMRWLVRLVTPVGGTVIDPFLGSGTTGMACRYEQRDFIGIEREADYIAIAERRIASVAPLFAEPVTSSAPTLDDSQADLFSLGHPA